jgi:hypothetical protein
MRILIEWNIKIRILILNILVSMQRNIWLNKEIGKYDKEWCHLIVSPGIEPGYIVFPSHKNNAYNLVKAYCYLCGKRKFLAVRQVGLMTHRKCRVDRPFPVTWLGNVWEPFPPPPAVQARSRLFNPCFPGLKSDTVMLSHGPVISCFGSHSSTPSSMTTSPLQFKIGA